MRRNVLNLLLNSTSIKAMLRKVADFLHFNNVSTKTGISIFGSTLLLGTGVVLATAQAGPTNSSIPPVPSASTKQADMPIGSNIPTKSQVLNTNFTSSGTTEQSSNDQENTATNHIEVTINGESIPMPANGSVHQTVINDSGTTTVDVNAQSSTQNGVNSYTNVQTHSTSFGTTNTSSTQSGNGN